MSNNPVRLFEQRVGDFIARHGMLSRKLNLVALSGGPDSVALLLVLTRLGFPVEAMHCNFHLRGADADSDEQFCIRLCESLSIPLHRVHFDTIEYAQLHKVSIEMAARNLRYAYFRQLLRDLNADTICVGHHRDDSVETMLINLMRGTGLNGLCGIRACHEQIVRPLLCVSREDIMDYLNALGQDYVIDRSNLVDDVVRNIVRLDIIPLMEKVNPSLKATLARTASHLEETAKVVEASMKRAKSVVLQDDAIDIGLLLEQDAPGGLLFYILHPYGFSSVQTEQILQCLSHVSGRQWQTETTEVLLDRGRLLISPMKTDIFKPMRIPEAGTYVIGENSKLTFAIETVGEDFRLSRSADCVCLDAEKARFPFTVRTVQPGDRFVPFGMKGSKLLSDFMTDQKLTLTEKRRQLVVADANDCIVWVVNRRPDNRFRITPDSRTVLRIALHA